MAKRTTKKAEPIRKQVDQFDLFGEKVEHDFLLREKFIEPPFSILDTKAALWRARRNAWKAKGIRSEVGRDKLTNTTQVTEWMKRGTDKGGSIFDPALCEVIYHWFCPPGGYILDPFAGGSVRGIVAAYLGYRYTGIDIRKEQINSNNEQVKEICKPEIIPYYLIGDSNELLVSEKFMPFDFLFSCPPYADLEKYSDLPGDISNMKYPEFIEAYGSIIKKSCALLKPGSFACFVVGEVRDKKGNFYGFVPDTITLFAAAGMEYYNECILLNAVGSGCIRAEGQFVAGKKLVKMHQNILIFKKHGTQIKQVQEGSEPVDGPEDPDRT